MHVCLICSQIAAWGKIGGFGTATRALGIGLIRSGFDVTAVVPRRSRHGQGSRESLDGITVLGVSPFETMTSGRIFREVDADIYHSQERQSSLYVRFPQPQPLDFTIVLTLTAALARERASPVR